MSEALTDKMSVPAVRGSQQESARSGAEARPVQNVVKGEGAPTHLILGGKGSAKLLLSGSWTGFGRRFTATAATSRCSAARSTTSPAACRRSSGQRAGYRRLSRGSSARRRVASALWWRIPWRVCRWHTS